MSISKRPSRLPCIQWLTALDARHYKPKETKMMMPIARAARALAVCALPAVMALWSPRARAAVAVELSLERLAGAATEVGVFMPLEQHADWEGGRIYTYSRVRLSSPVAGENTGTELWVRTRGGVVGAVGQWVDGEPILTIGQPTLLFLRRSGGNAFQVVGRAQGQYRITMAAPIAT
jgi:hypothetical protein